MAGVTINVMPTLDRIPYALGFIHTVITFLHFLYCLRSHTDYLLAVDPGHLYVTPCNGKNFPSEVFDGFNHISKRNLEGNMKPQA
jgi:hypothetical protein